MPRGPLHFDTGIRETWGHTDNHYDHPHADSHGDQDHSDEHWDTPSHGDDPVHMDDVHDDDHVDEPHQDVRHEDHGHDDAHHDAFGDVHDDRHGDEDPHNDYHYDYHADHQDEPHDDHADEAHDDEAHDDEAHDDEESTLWSRLEALLERLDRSYELRDLRLVEVIETGLERLDSETARVVRELDRRVGAIERGLVDIRRRLDEVPHYDR